ncbi:nuclear pore complex protein GP210 isoform X4 [Ananas comosus]|nr:nuclear pore complex protein GP210 isoform X4 [Ananas comosus]
MSLDPPSPVYVTIGAFVHYKLRIIRLNTVKVIDLPSRHHRWYVTNSSVAWIDGVMGTTHALNLGFTDIIVEDIRVSGHIQTSSMHVVIPHKLSLYLVPVTNASIPLQGITPIPASNIWYVFPGQEYAISVKAFADESDANEIHITENNNLKLESSTIEYWILSQVSHDVAVTCDWKNSRLFTPISEGKGFLTASITYQKGNTSEAEVLKHVQEVNVCRKVKLIINGRNESSDIIRLPWAPGVFQELELKAIGGCGRTFEDYRWFSSDTGVIYVSASGIIRAKRPGRATVKVFSAFDSINYDEVVIEVSIPSSMVILPKYPVEAIVGTELQAAVTLKTSDGSFYSRCDAFYSFVRWKVLSENESFKIINMTGKLSTFNAVQSAKGVQTSHAYPCAWTYLNATCAGRATIAATLSFESQSSFEPFDKPIILKASSTISAYYPLLVFQAETGDKIGGYWVDLTRLQTGLQDLDSTGLDELYLVPGSSMDILLLGGPERWGQKVEYVETVDVLDEPGGSITSSVVVQSSPSAKESLYRVSCQLRGKSKLLFSRGNLVGIDHPMPAVASVQLVVICDFPSSITLIANEPANTLDAIQTANKVDRGARRLWASPIIVSNGRTMRVAAVGIHATERAFANSSSLCLRWELTGCEGLAYWSDMNSVERFEAAMWERFLVLLNASGLCTVRATVTGFSQTNSDLYEKAYSLHEGAEDVLTDAFRLQMVSSLRVIPESVLLVFNPEAKVNLSVAGGTCFLKAVINDTQVAHIIQHPENVLCSYLIVGVKGLGTALLTVHDIGLSPPAAASSLVRVANIDWIKLIAEEEISLMEGATRSFDILAGTQDGNVFEFSQYMYMNIEVHIEDEVIVLITENDYSRAGGWVLNEPKFSIRAAHLGVTSLYVSARQQYGRKILSQVIKVEVYEPLRVHPDYIYLVPAASYVVTFKGGPKVGASVEFISTDEEIATIHKETGKLLASSIGNATVRAAVYANGGTLLCEAFGRVEVGIPPAMTLSTQSTQLCVGCSMPIFPSFPEGDLFSFYEICQGYFWTTENDKVVNFHVNKELPCEAKELPCFSSNSDKGYINVLIGRSAGKTRVSISVSCDFVLTGDPQRVTYNASKSVTVVADPPLALGLPITWVLPPFYTTSELLPRSPGIGRPSSRNSESSITYSLLRSCDQHDLLKSKAITIDGSTIKTSDSKNLACIQAKDQSTGRTEIASCVRVTEVTQVRAAIAESSFHEAYLAVGDKIDLSIKYCDVLGYMFYEAKGVVPVDVDTNYPNIVSMIFPKDENSTHGTNEHVILQARSPGSALVRISIDHNPKKADFILVSVGALIYPRNPVIHVGHTLNFTVVGDGGYLYFVGMDGFESGRWQSGNDSVLSVNAITGEVHACGEGVAEVFFKKSNMKLQTTVTVLKVDQIIVDAPSEILTNIPYPSEGYKFPIRFSDSMEGKHKFEAVGKRVEASFDCKVAPPFIGYAKPWSDHVTKKSYCVFFPYSPRQLLSLMPKSDVNLEKDSESGVMYVSIVASLREDPSVMGSSRAPFVGGFSIAEGKLNITPHSNKSVLTIIGNTDVEIYWNTKDLLSIKPLKSSGAGVGSRVEYQVEVLQRQPFTDKIYIVLPETGQTEEVDVSYEAGEREQPVRVTGITWPAILICAFVLVLTVLIFLRLLDKPERSTASTPSSTVVTGPATPPRISAPVDSNLSPRTPQPFIEYVRRTIDETPYYRRGARRYDPQYTY